MVFLTKGPMSSGASGEILTVFLAQGLALNQVQGQGVGMRDETEDIEVLRISINEIANKLSVLQSEGNHVDLKIYGLIELAKKYLE
jgi:ADP-ribose pyrophosphatase